MAFKAIDAYLHWNREKYKKIAFFSCFPCTFYNWKLLFTISQLLAPPRWIAFFVSLFYFCKVFFFQTLIGLLELNGPKLQSNWIRFSVDRSINFSSFLLFSNNRGLYNKSPTKGNITNKYHYIGKCGMNKKYAIKHALQFNNFSNDWCFKNYCQFHMYPCKMWKYHPCPKN